MSNRDLAARCYGSLVFGAVFVLFAAFVLIAFAICWLMWGLPKLIAQLNQRRPARAAQRAKQP